MTKHSEKIFRTVVFAGAMLGAPLVSADAPQKPTKAPDAKKVDTVDSVTKEIAAVNVELKQATDAVANAQNQADRDAAKAKLEQRKKQKVELEKKLADLKQGTTPAQPSPLAKLEQEIAAADIQLKQATDAVASAQNQADREAAKAKLEQRKKQKVELETKLAELKKSATPATPLQKLDQELTDKTLQINAAVDAVMAAQNDADRKAAKAKLEVLRKDKVELERKIAAEKQKLARPRTPENDRPIGRGFVLA